jgi:hypothetical protein
VGCVIHFALVSLYLIFPFIAHSELYLLVFNSNLFWIGANRLQTVKQQRQGQQ